MLLIENVTVRFGGVTALDDFSALLEPGHPGGRQLHRRPVS
jgi:ABC-type uncharacterized transport system ATPase subunit